MIWRSLQTKNFGKFLENLQVSALYKVRKNQIHTGGAVGFGLPRLKGKISEKTDDLSKLE